MTKWDEQMMELSHDNRGLVHNVMMDFINGIINKNELHESLKQYTSNEDFIQYTIDLSAVNKVLKEALEVEDDDMPLQEEVDAIFKTGEIKDSYSKGSKTLWKVRKLLYWDNGTNPLDFNPIDSIYFDDFHKRYGPYITNSTDSKSDRTPSIYGGIPPRRDGLVLGYKTYFK